MSNASPLNSEWLTRKQHIDPALKTLGWPYISGQMPKSEPHRLEEFETANGPADYALGFDNRIVGVVEAKKLTLGPQNVLTKAERYSRGASSNGFNFAGFHIPFLYSTNGQVIWFRDARHPLNRSRRVATFHTPAALRALLNRDFDAAIAVLGALAE
jgi:type I restriction enzyme R subunit